MTNVKNRFKKLTIGILLSLLPFILGLVFAELLFLTAKPVGGMHEQAERNYASGIVVLIGLVMSAVALCGMGLYALDTICRILIVERQARKIERLRRQGKV